MIKRLLYGCFFRHGERIRERDPRGVLVLRCPLCDDVHVPDLRIDVLEKGPAHQPTAILGSHDYVVRTAATKSKTLKFGRG